MSIAFTLHQILALAGKLDDTLGAETARERFRQFLKQNVHEVGQVRDYIEECLRNSGDQYNRALQDLVNYLGYFLEFEVMFGRYQGVQGQIGYDGYWKSARDFNIVIEVKTTDAYAIRTSTLVGYIDRLISEKAIANWDCTLGLYVVGRPDVELRQLENAIIAEKRTHQLRIISTESLLSLAEIASEYKITHEEILSLLRPSEPKIDTIVDLISRLVAQQRSERLEDTTPALDIEPEMQPQKPPQQDTVVYWLTSVKSDEQGTAEDSIKLLVGQDHVYAFGDGNPGRKLIKPDDWICFYAAGKGIIAHAKVASQPEKKQHKNLRHPEKYPWTFRLHDEALYINKPVVISAEVRSNLDAFQGRDLNTPWAWFVQATHTLSQHDFCLLTRQ